LRRSPSSDLVPIRLSFYIYRLNVILASAFTLLGAYLHAMDPVPIESTTTWKLFLCTLTSTPILFPIALQFGLFPRSPKASIVVYFLFSLFSHLYLILFEVDFSPYLPSFFFNPVVLPGFGLFPDAVLDGRSIGGADYNIPVDFLSSVPYYHGSSVFPHCILFTIAAVYSLVLTRTAPACPSGLLRALELMVFGQLTMVPILVFAGIQVRGRARGAKRRYDNAIASGENHACPYFSTRYNSTVTTDSTITKNLLLITLLLTATHSSPHPSSQPLFRFASLIAVVFRHLAYQHLYRHAAGVHEPYGLGRSDWGEEEEERYLTNII